MNLSTVVGGDATVYNLPAIAKTPTPITAVATTRSPTEIEEIRNNCPSDEKNTSGDEGLQTFTVSGAQAVLVDQLNFCGEGRTCIHGVNCATGYTHQVEIYVRRGSVWVQSFSIYATEPIFLSVEPNENPRFRALVLSVGGGDDTWAVPYGTKMIRQPGNMRNVTSS